MIAVLQNLASGTADGRPVAIVRVVVGCAAIGEALIQWHLLSAMLQPNIVSLPILQVPRLTVEALPFFVGGWIVTAAAFAAGRWLAATGPVLASVLGYILVVDQQTHSNHVYLMALMVALVTCADGGRSRQVPLWPVMLLRVQLSIVYTFAALSKLNPSYLSGAVFFRSVRPAVWEILPAGARAPEVMTALALLSIGFEVFLAAAFWSDYWRRPAVVLGSAFHVALALSLQDPRFTLVVFGALMLALYVSFCDPRALRGKGATGDRGIAVAQFWRRSDFPDRLAGILAPSASATGLIRRHNGCGSAPKRCRSAARRASMASG